LGKYFPAPFSSCELGQTVIENARARGGFQRVVKPSVQSASSADSSKKEKNLDIFLPSQVSSVLAKPGYEEAQ
jgi:hypothetical protein